MREKFILPTFSRSVNQLKDLDGNIYTTVVIGTQEWIVENWRCTKYVDGSAIPNLQTGVYDDWFLPSDGEIEQMYNELAVYGVGGFTEEAYFTSTEVDANSFVAYNFDGEGGGGRSKDTTGITIHTRACRSFEGEVGEYELRDTGPAGGLIFIVDGTTYYEAAPSDQSTSSEQIWSNIIDQATGATGSAIGTGIANTAAIIAQAGHTDSAAKLCDDLSIGGWINDTTGAYCAYDNDNDNIDPYGLLYNWYAVDNVKGMAYLERNGIQELGWRVPTHAELQQLNTYLGGANIAGGKLKSTRTAPYDHPRWNSPNTGATNESGFSGLPSGSRNELAVFNHIGTIMSMWSKTELNVDDAYTWILAYSNDNFQLGSVKKIQGRGIRLVRDVS